MRIYGWSTIVRRDTPFTTSCNDDLPRQTRRAPEPLLLLLDAASNCWGWDMLTSLLPSALEIVSKRHKFLLVRFECLLV